MILLGIKVGNIYGVRRHKMDEDFEPEVFKAMMKTIQVKGFNPKYFYK